MNLRLKRNRRDFLNGRELRASRLPAYPSNQTELPNFPTVSKVVDNFLTSGLFIVNSTDPHFNFMRGVRYKVMCAQMSAHRAARFQLVELPLLKEQARRFMDALDSSTPILASIVDADAQKLSFELSDFMKSGPDLPLAHLSALQDAARLFQTTCARFYKQFPYNIRPNTNRDELSWHFIGSRTFNSERRMPATSSRRCAVSNSVWANPP